MTRSLRGIILSCLLVPTLGATVLLVSGGQRLSTATAQDGAPTSIQGSWFMFMGLGCQLDSICAAGSVEITQSGSSVSMGFGCYPYGEGDFAVSGNLTGTYSGGTINLGGAGYFYPPGEILGREVTLSLVANWVGDYFSGSWTAAPEAAGCFDLAPNFSFDTPTPTVTATDTPTPAPDTPTPVATATPVDQPQAIDTIQRLVDKACGDQVNVHQCDTLQRVLAKLVGRH